MLNESVDTKTVGPSRKLDQLGNTAIDQTGFVANVTKPAAKTLSTLRVVSPVPVKILEIPSTQLRSPATLGLAVHSETMPIDRTIRPNFKLRQLYQILTTVHNAMYYIIKIGRRNAIDSF